MRRQVAASGTYGWGGDSLSDIPKIQRRYGDCDVTITFKESADNVKDKVLWLLMENYRERLAENKQDDAPQGVSDDGVAT